MVHSKRKALEDITAVALSGSQPFRAAYDTGGKHKVRVPCGLSGDRFPPASSSKFLLTFLYPQFYTFIFSVRASTRLIKHQNVEFQTLLAESRVALPLLLPSL